ncbi:MmcQ/YjbR family DNA-binding protein [Candidatus Saccharibacteria bacterium]|nr:MAG: MmcQ/YjbR family DNA-binding protein [Candidatus Saccharibacteria bacterium]
MDHKAIEEMLMSLPNVWLDYPFGEDAAVYKIGDKDKGEGKMFAIIAEGSEPVRLSLKCDPQLAELLREKYETVLPGYHLNKKHWNTIICSGQVPLDEIKDLIRHSYELVVS